MGSAGAVLSARTEETLELASTAPAGRPVSCRDELGSGGSYLTPEKLVCMKNVFRPVSYDECHSLGENGERDENSEDDEDSEHDEQGNDESSTVVVPSALPAITREVDDET